MVLNKSPKWNPISVSGYHIREAGSTAPQEIGLTIANAISYIDAAVERGLEIDSFCPRISFFFGCHNDFIEEICKFRAARTLWYQVMKERYDFNDVKSARMRFHTQTAGVTLTAQQSQNNVVRVAFQALAAVLGGTNPCIQMDMTKHWVCQPGIRHLALRTQQIIANETGITNHVDPSGPH